MRRVVITGMGIWSCIGQNQQEVTESLRMGRSGIGEGVFLDSRIFREEFGHDEPAAEHHLVACRYGSGGKQGAEFLAVELKVPNHGTAENDPLPTEGAHPGIG